MTTPTHMDLIASAVASDANGFRDAFDRLMGEKISAAIADKKIEVAQNYFNGEADEDAEQDS